MMYIDELQDDNLFWWKFDFGFQWVYILTTFIWEGGARGGMGVRFLDFGVPNMFPKLFPIVIHSNNPFYCEARLVNQIIQE